VELYFHSPIRPHYVLVHTAAMSWGQIGDPSEWRTLYGMGTFLNMYGVYNDGVSCPNPLSRISSGLFIVRLSRKECDAIFRKLPDSIFETRSEPASSTCDFPSVMLATGVIKYYRRCFRLSIYGFVSSGNTGLL
jgi:hypothetical protein